MELLKEFISEYGTTILYAIITAIAGYLGLVFKKIYTKYVNDKVKRDVARTVVLGVEQIYKDLHGDEKLQRALSAASEMLAEKGIQITDLELRMLIEAALAEFNDAFSKETDAEPEVETIHLEEPVAEEYTQEITEE